MDSKQARKIIQSGVELATNLAELTPTPLDDDVVDVMARIVADDEYWALAWHTIERAIGYIDRENRHLVVEADASLGNLTDLCECEHCDVCAVIQVMIEILQWWSESWDD